MAKREGGRGHGDIQTLLAEQEASGLSVAAFARKHGLPRWLLYEGRRRLRKRAERDKKAAFVEVKVRPLRPAPRPIEVDLKTGVRVHVPVGFDAGELRRLLGVLASC